MKIICVSGAPGSDVNKVADIFYAAGVQPAQPLSQDASFTLASWHEKVLASAGRQAALRPVQQPGRFWEQLAANLFLENMRHPMWAWADPRSVWLLDFWQQFEPNLHFVLVYTSPQRALAEALAAEREHGADTASLMAAWEAHQTEILRFHHRNPQRTILVDAAECLAAPAALLDACAARWELELAPGAGRLPAPPAPAPLVGYLAEQLRQTHPNLQVLQQELQASLHALLPGQPVGSDTPELLDAVEDYRLMHGAAARAEVLAHEVEALSGRLASLDSELGRVRLAEAGLQAEHDAAVRRAQQLAGELAQASDSARALAEENAEHRRSIAALKEALAQQQAEAASLKAALAETRSESELLLQQMHQLQEEMERWFLENKELGEIKASSRRTIDELNKKVTQYEASVATLKKELDTARQGVKRLEDEQGKRKAAHDAAVKENATLKAKLDAAVKDAATAKPDAEAARRAREAQQENELLLVQLHQVQEELEHYFLEHKNASKQNEALQQRWQRMLERNPDYCDYRSLDLLGNDGATRTSWRFTELNAAGRAFAELRFDMVVTDGVAAFAFARDGKAPGAPEALEQLGTADWLLLPTLCRVLDEALQAPAGSVAQLSDAQRGALREALAALTAVIAATPAALRFDRISLKREQVNPDYEHLWLQLGNLSLGERRWADFEFRLSCANVRPGKFGTHPKLEFPAEAGAVLFDSWFAESHDDFGDKLELRFALPEAMDMSVWEQLSQADREMLKRLIALLPRALSRLEDGQATLARPFADWQQLAAGIQAILAIRTAAVAAMPAPAPAPAAVPAQVAMPPQAGKARKARALPKGLLK